MAADISLGLAQIESTGVLTLAAAGLLWRAVNLQWLDRDFLQRQGDARIQRVADIAAHRGTITDRFGEPLAVSTPVDSIWANPRELAAAIDKLPQLAKALNRNKTELTQRITSNLDREFLYLSRHMQGLVLALWHSGMRTGEAVQLCSRDVTMTGKVWIFRQIGRAHV